MWVVCSMPSVQEGGLAGKVSLRVLSVTSSLIILDFASLLVTYSPLCRFAVELVYLRIALVVVWEVPALYILIVRIKRQLNNVKCVRVRPEELRLKVWIQANQILIDENLPAHTGTGADADRWNL